MCGVMHAKNWGENRPVGNCLFSCHELVLGLCTALAHARLHPIHCGKSASHTGVHDTCTADKGIYHPVNIS